MFFYVFDIRYFLIRLLVIRTSGRYGHWVLVIGFKILTNAQRHKTILVSNPNNQ